MLHQADFLQDLAEARHHSVVLGLAHANTARSQAGAGGTALLSCSCAHGCDVQLDRLPYTGSVEPETEKSPLHCPECGFAPGVPHRAATVLGEPGLIRLGIRCPDCWHAWQITVRSDDFPTPPKTRS